ncbi:hypothetical protein FG386_003538 [Cryptosporidium ryanae]|uniref:uncharacterized protein n=1 Tax=Cryptosporidium ryanae TaxID=515981 RepID=UPI00351A7A99|nr:hypothetical protein FG386_003538 [Cryptosporidium ryanae]
MNNWGSSDSVERPSDVPVVDNWEDLLNSDEETNEITNTITEKQSNSINESHNFRGNIDKNELIDEKRRQELVEEMDGSAMDDLFDGFVENRKLQCNKNTNNNTTQIVSNINQQPDFFSQINFNSYGKVEHAAFKIADCIRPALAKSPAWLRFVDICLNEIFPKLDIKDLKTIKKKIDNQLSIKEKEEREKSQQKKKPNDITSLSRNFREELDIFDGVDSLEESDDY